MNDLLNLVSNNPLTTFGIAIGSVLVVVITLVLLFGRDRVAGWIAAVYNDHLKPGGGSGAPVIAMVLLFGALSACSDTFDETRSSVESGAGAAEIAATAAKETADAVAESCAPPESLSDALIGRWVSDGIDWLADLTSLSDTNEDLKARHARDCAALKAADDQAE